MESQRGSDPGNPREIVLPATTILPGKGELKEYAVPITIHGKRSEKGLVLDAASAEDATRIAQEFLDCKFVSRDSYELHTPYETGGEVTWSGDRQED
jgi:hypothetical protein